MTGPEVNISCRMVWFSAGRGTPLFLRMLSEFLEQSESTAESVHLVVGDRYYYEEALRMNEDQRIRLVYQHQSLAPFRNGGPVESAELARLEERYGCPNLWRFVLAERIIHHLSYEKKVRYLYEYLKYFEDLYNKIQPQLFITGGVDCLPVFVAHEVFRRNGCHTFVVRGARLPHRFFIQDNAFEQLPFLKETYESAKARDLSTEERVQADEVRDAFAKGRVRPSYYRSRPGIGLAPSLRRVVSRLVRYYKFDDKYFDYRLTDSIRLSVLTRLKAPVNRWSLSRTSAQQIPGGDFFYFPLHLEPEASLDILGVHYRDQKTIIRRIAESLPAGFSLCVKEHPNMLPGRRPLNYYAELSRIGGVRLLSPKLDSYNIIERSRGVITIAGTSGFEALFYGKPVLLLGRAFYEVFREGVWRSAGWERFPETLSAMAESPGFDGGLLDRFVVAVLQRTHEGFRDLDDSRTFAPENIRSLAAGLVKELRFRLAREGVS